jgi:soluble lytic murein transglycosylase-like protein
MPYMKIFCVTLLLSMATIAHGEDLCFEEAGVDYGINPRILKAIAKAESNFNPRAVNWNKNGTYDFGIMQINSMWGYTLGRDWWNTLGDPCSNIKGGAMILSNCMKKYGYTWEAIGCYNSQTPSKRDKYAVTIFKKLQEMQQTD